MKSDRCICFGCPNYRSQGTFVGDLCTPCHQYITTGKVGPTESFLQAISLSRTKKDITILIEKRQAYHAVIRLNQLGFVLHLMTDGEPRFTLISSVIDSHFNPDHWEEAGAAETINILRDLSAAFEHGWRARKKMKTIVEAFKCIADDLGLE